MRLTKMCIGFFWGTGLLSVLVNAIRPIKLYANLEILFTDIFEPEIASDYFLEQIPDRIEFLNAGIMGSTPEIDNAATQGGRTVTMPQWDDLPNGDSNASEVVTDTDDLTTPEGLTTDTDVAVKHFRAKSWRAPNVVRYASGSDPLVVVLDNYIRWWAREVQRLLLKTLTGIFADATVATNLQHDIASEDGDAASAANLVSKKAIETAIFKLGDQFAGLSALVMHSVVLQELRDQDEITFVPVSNQDPINPNVTELAFYQGKRVFVDDNITKTAGTTSGFKYDTYIFGVRAIAFAPVPLETGDFAVEPYRDPRMGKGGGGTEIITRNYFILHPRGIKWGGTLTAGNAGPTDAQISADNYTQVWLTKNIRLVRLRTNG